MYSLTYSMCSFIDWYILGYLLCVTNHIHNKTRLILSVIHLFYYLLLRLMMVLHIVLQTMTAVFMWAMMEKPGEGHWEGWLTQGSPEEDGY